MPNGGARPGAGRKKGSKAAHTIEAETYRKILIAEVVKHAVPLAQALVAKGLMGDVPALKEINERTLGKVTDRTEVTGADGKDLFPVPILANMNVPADHSNETNRSADQAD